MAWGVWQVCPDGELEIHVMPCDENGESPNHVADWLCPCSPTLDPESGPIPIYIHNQEQ